MNKEYKELREEIIKVVPETIKHCSLCKNGLQYGEDFCSFCGNTANSLQPITLEDILIWIEKIKPTRIMENNDDVRCGERIESAWYEKQGIIEMWELGQSLENQSDETINFLHNLIIKYE